MWRYGKGGRSFLMIGTRVVFGIALLLLLTSSILASPLQQGCATMGFNPTTVSVAQVGDTVVLQVLLDADGVTFDAVGFLVNFDQMLLQVVDAAGDPASQIEPGDLPGFNVMNTASNIEGTIEFSQAIIGGQAGGTFTIATIRLKVIAALPAGDTQVVFVGRESKHTGVFEAGTDYLCGDPQPATITTTITTCYDFQPPAGVGIEDVMVVANLWGQLAGPPYDCDGDGVITVVDIMCVVIHWGETCP
jgi:hypothetical protein